MSLAQTILPEFDQEMKGVRRALERVPDDRLDWRPHPKSMTLGRLASHLAELPVWAVNSLKHDSLDIAPPGQPTPRGANLGSREEILAHFDAKAAEARAVIAETPDEAFGQPWSLLRGGQEIFTLPRLAVLRTAVLNHMIHHRGQLTVFLRLNDVPVPSLYGPTADEPTF